MTPPRSLPRALAIAALIFVLDQASKLWVVNRLDLPAKGRIEVLDPWFNLVMAWNQGVNFGLLDLGPGGRGVLAALALAIVAGILWWIRGARGWAAAIGGGLVVGGALGNVIDRIRWGAVADFVNMSCCGLNNPYVFNISDTSIFVGIATLLIFGVEPQPARARGRDGGDGIG